MAKSKSTEKANTSVKAKEVSKDQADKMSDYAQNLDDEITHFVDYGDLKEKKQK
jgi:hypothetical protein|tara:strand:+ start:547 stop:708 length:162 start_codon:yes stop_codon:yes gene_type:complete